MVNKKAKRRIRGADKTGIVIAILIAFAVMIGMFMASLTIQSEFALPQKALPQTVYLSSNQFPIIAYGSYKNVTFTEFIFYGTPQPNRTECMSGIADYPLIFNSTNMSISSIQLINTTNPEKVEELYNYTKIYYYFGINTTQKAHDYTLLCPNIVNATK